MLGERIASQSEVIRAIVSGYIIIHGAGSRTAAAGGSQRLGPDLPLPLPSRERRLHAAGVLLDRSHLRVEEQLQQRRVVVPAPSARQL